MVSEDLRESSSCGLVSSSLQLLNNEVILNRFEDLFFFCVTKIGPQSTCL
jgi:hypothetical protein